MNGLSGGPEGSGPPASGSFQALGAHVEDVWEGSAHPEQAQPLGRLRSWVPSRATIAKVMAPKGVTPLFTVQKPGEAPVIHTPALLAAFSAAHHSGQIGLCKLAETDDWQMAFGEVNRQMLVMGGKLVMRSQAACGCAPDGTSLYMRKCYECRCGRKLRGERREEHRGGNALNTRTGTHVSGSIKEDCKVSITLVNFWREEMTQDGRTISPGIYLQAISDECHNHDFLGTPGGFDITDDTRERFWAAARSYRNGGLKSGAAWSMLTKVEEFRHLVTAHDLTALKVFQRLRREDGALGVRVHGHMETDDQRINKRQDDGTGSSKAPPAGGRARQIGQEARTDQAFLHGIDPFTGKGKDRQSAHHSHTEASTMEQSMEDLQAGMAALEPVSRGRGGSSARRASGEQAQASGSSIRVAAMRGGQGNSEAERVGTDAQHHFPHAQQHDEAAALPLTTTGRKRGRSDTHIGDFGLLMARRGDHAAAAPGEGMSSVADGALLERALFPGFNMMCSRDPTTIVSVFKEHMIGQALGLATYITPDGSKDSSRPGAALVIDAQLFPGKGIIHLNSRDKDDILQSAQLAWHVVRTRAARIQQLLGVTRPLPNFDELDVSIKADPFGICKGGTSAGAATAVAYMSLVTNLRVDRLTAFTGALDLRGRVHQVGSVSVKARAAVAVGAARLVCPTDNANEVPEGLLLDVKPIANLKDLLAHALVDEKGQPVTLVKDHATLGEDGLSATDAGAYLGWAYYLLGVVSDKAPEEKAAGSAGKGQNQPGNGKQDASSGDAEVALHVMEPRQQQEIKVTLKKKKARADQGTSSSVPAIGGDNARQAGDAEVFELVDLWPRMSRVEVQVLLFEGDKLYHSGKPYKESKQGVQACQWVKRLTNEDFTSRGLPVRPGMDLSKQYSMHVHYVEDSHTPMWHASPVFLAAVSAITGLEPDPTIVAVGDVSGTGVFRGMRGLFDLDQRLTVGMTNVRTVIVPKEDEYTCKKVLAELVAGGHDSVGELTFVGAETIWDVVKVAFRRKGVHTNIYKGGASAKAPSITAGRGEANEGSAPQRNGVAKEFETL